MKKRYFKFLLITISCLFLSICCTNKEINLITNIDFEMQTDHEAIGFVQDSLATSIIVVPERTNYPNFQYYVNYKVTHGQGYYVTTNGSVVPEESDIPIFFENDFTADWRYIGTAAGDHTITIGSKDNFGRSKVTSLTYEVKAITIDWEATSPQTMAQANDTIPMQLRLTNNSEGLELTYEYSIAIAEGAGLVLDANKDPIALNKTLEITEGVYQLFYIGAAIGKNTLQFDLVTSNAIEKTTSLDFDIKEELKNEAPTAVADTDETTLGIAKAIDVLANDSDPEGDTLTIISVTIPANGTAIIENGKILYTPNATFIGNEPFEYTIIDAAGNEATGSITVVVKMREILAIPDPNFEQALIDLGHDDVVDQKMFKDVAESITTLDVSNKGIADLTGIEGFVNLESFTAGYNNLTSLDITKNTKLTFLNVEFNKIKAIDLTNNRELVTVVLWDSDIASIDISKNVLLEVFDIVGNPISELDTSANKKLKILKCGFSNVTGLDLSQNLELLQLNVGNSQLTSIDVTMLTKLDRLSLFGVNLSELDVRNNTNLDFIAVSGGNIASIDLSTLSKLTGLWIVSTKLTTVNLDNNTLLTDLRLDGNLLTFV